MKQTKQILLAFFVPLFLAIGLLLLRIFIFYSPFDPWMNNASPYKEYELPQHLIIMIWFIVGLFILSLILPSFVMMRTFQNRRNKLESASIIE